MKLIVSEKNVEDALMPFCRYCPVENALLDAGYHNVNVADTTATATKEGKPYLFDLSIELTKQINRYDTTSQFDPGEYQIDIRL